MVGGSDGGERGSSLFTICVRSYDVFYGAIVGPKGPARFSMYLVVVDTKCTVLMTRRNVCNREERGVSDKLRR